MRNVILIVEGSREIKEEISKKILDDLGMSVHLIPCKNLRSATSEFTYRTIDIVILSLTLDDTPGIVALEAIRHLNDDVPVIVTDSNPSQQREQQSIAYGASNYIDTKKGFSQLTGIIVELLKLVRDRRASVNAFESRLDSVVKVIEDYQKIINGNAKSIGDLTTQVELLSCIIKGDAQGPGLIQESRESMAFRVSVYKLFWVILSTSLAAIIASIFASVFTYWK